MESSNLMPPRNEISRQTSRKVQKPDSKSRPWRHRLPICLAVAGLAVVSLACAIFGPTTDDVVIRIQLPTLTRTPLPTFTPTATAAQAAVVMTSEPTVADVTPSETNSTTLDEASANSPVAASATLTNNVSVPTNSNASTQQQPQAGAALANAPPPAAETPTPSATATEEVPPTALPTSTPTETPIPLPKGWIFSGVRPIQISGGRYLLIHGILFNNTGATQTLNQIKGIFPDNSALVSDNNYRDFYPVNEVPQGSRIPFKLLIPGQTSIGEFELEAVASEGGNGPRQEFEYLEVNAAIEGDNYCVTGKVRNTGSELNNYLVVAAVLYDQEDKVINYYNYDEESPRDLVGDQVRDVSICVDPLNQEVARYELQAWGL